MAPPAQRSITPAFEKKQQLKQEEQLSVKEQLAYYKKRVDDFENERTALLESFEKCSVQASDLHRLDWENRRRADEIRELQKALSDAHVFLFDERQRLLTLQAENDELRLQEIEDRKRIQQLLEYDPLIAARSGAAGAGSGASHDALMLKIESLQAQMDEQRQLSEERINALLEDRRIREQEEQAHRTHMNQLLEQSAQKIKHTEELLRHATKDSILSRREKQQAEERALAAEAELLTEKHTLMEEISVLKSRSAEEVRQIRQHGESKLEDIASNLRKQLRKKEDELVNLGSLHTSTKSQLEKKVVDLEGRVSKLTEQNRQLETRRHMDMEGFTADITNLRKMLAATDRKLHEMRLVQRLGEDDRLDTILAHLRERAPDVALEVSDQRRRQDDQESEVTHSAKSELNQGLKEIKGRLKGLEERLQSKKKALAAGAAALAPPAPALHTRRHKEHERY